MTASDLASIEAIFFAALEQDGPGPRGAYLDEACGGDPKLRRRIDELLRAHQNAGSFLDNLDAFTGVRRVGPLDEIPAPTIGPYRLLEAIGEGGMGVVYRAEQTQPVRRLVALKVVKAGMDTKQVIARFEAERQALALMNHPNIARVYDAGSTEQGRPYFVMELVRGLPLTDYCDQARLSITDRLELFILVCQAVQHAHQKGVVHRDLKPSNILVTLQDGVAVPKVIDFGVAKATGPSLTDKTLHTVMTQLVGTPVYMSPEQAELSGIDVDTRTDIYALGVLLYELLTGTTPFDKTALQSATFDEMRRILREVEPPRPSLRLGTLGATVTTVSGQRGCNPQLLKRSIRGDLDWIVMKALEKERKRRYESAGGFASDIRRFLRHQPVDACPPSNWYRFIKYVRRNQVALLSTSLVGLALVAGLGASLWQASLARQAQRRAEADRDRATDAEMQAAAISGFLQNDLLMQAGREAQLNSGFEPNANLTVKDALDRAAARIGERFANQPRLEATMRRTIGKAYHALGEEKLAARQLEQAVALSRVHLGERHPETLDAQYFLAMAYQFTGQLPAAVALLEHVWTASSLVFGPDELFTLKALNGLGEALRKVGDHERAAVFIQKALGLKLARFGPEHPSTQNSLHDLGLVYLDMGRLDEAIACLEEATVRLRVSSGDDHPDTLYSLNNLVAAYDRAGRPAEADRVIRDTVKRVGPTALPILESAMAPLMSRARGLMDQGRFVEAEPLLRRCLDLRTPPLPSDTRRHVIQSQLGEVLLSQGKLEEAGHLLRAGYDGITRFQASFSDPGVRLNAATRLARYYERIGQPEKAAALKHP